MLTIHLINSYKVGGIVGGNRAKLTFGQVGQVKTHFVQTLLIKNIWGRLHKWGVNLSNLSNLTSPCKFFAGNMHTLTYRGMCILVVDDYPQHWATPLTPIPK
jgi:hypothetical protein